MASWAPKLIRLVLALVVLVAGIAGGVAGAQPSGNASTWNDAWPMSDAFLAESRVVPDDSISRYELDVTLDPSTTSIFGSMRVVFTNHTGQALTEAPFRLYPNAAYYLEGALTVSGVMVDGIVADSDLAVDDTVLFVKFADPLQPEEEVEISLDFSTTVPVNSLGSFGIFSYDVERQTWILSDWYPILAGWDVDSGWGLEPPTIWGDPTFAESSLYTARVTVPRGMSVVGTGQETRELRTETQDRYLIQTGPVRELTMVLDDGFVQEVIEANGVEVALSLDASATGDMSAFLAYSAEAVEEIGALLGPYPYDELDIVQTELAGALGVSWSGVLFIDAAAVEQQLATAGQPGSQMTFILTHEIGHQWWGGMIGVNSNDHAFMNESLANYTSVLVYERLFGEDAGASLLQSTMAAPYLAFLAEQPDMPVDRPVGEIESATAFGRLVYGKGSLGLHAIRLEIGDAAFLEALRTYGAEYAFSIGSPDALLAAFESASGEELDALWALWFQSGDVTPDDVQQLLRAA
ncbi:MAG: M1 family metallopeptidase [Thermomicrobiales bacterium]|nr:M1 family metallopeptidase [Thermomicrobiales bacterium]